MKLRLYDISVLNNDGGILTYENKTVSQLTKLLTNHFKNNFNSDVIVSRDMILNLTNKTRSSNKFFKIFIKKLIKKSINAKNDIVETHIINI